VCVSWHNFHLMCKLKRGADGNSRVQKSYAYVKLDLHVVCVLSLHSFRIRGVQPQFASSMLVFLTGVAPSASPMEVVLPRLLLRGRSWPVRQL